MKLGLGHVRNKRSDQHGRFTLSDERRSSSDNGLGTRDTESPEDEVGKLLDEPLEEADVVEDLDQGNEEDDGGDDAEEEHGQLRNVGVGQEGDTILGESQKVLGASGDESENIVTNASSEHKQTDNVLRKHTSNDSSPIDALAILARQPQDEEEDGKTEQADGAVLAGVVLDLLRDKGADENDGNGKGCASEGSELFWDPVVDDKGGMLPDPANWARDISDGDVEEEQTQRDGEPEEEGNDPVLVIAVKDQRRDPPTGEQEEEEEVSKRAMMSVEEAKLSIAAGFTSRLFTVMHNARLDLFMIAIVRRCRPMSMTLLDAELLIAYTVVVVLVVVEGTLRRDQGRIEVGATGISDIVVTVGRINPR